MSATHTRVTIGTKPAEAIIAEFKATLPVREYGPPAGLGWVESSELLKALGFKNGLAFRRAALKNVRAGVWERARGAKAGRGGRHCGAYYYRVAKPVTGPSK